MTLTLPDDPALEDLTESDICLDLACALFARGQVSKLVAARIAGVELFEFDSELERRNIPSCTAESLAEDMDAIRTLFQR